MAIPNPACERVYARRVKPGVDRVLALVVLVVVASVLVAVALAVRSSLGRPVLYRQTRVGRHGRPFTLYKFRTMLPDRRHAAMPYAGADRRVSYEATDDPRHTPLSRVLRRWSLDELPQLWNVVRGEMSLVGPRPEVPQVIARYQQHSAERHAMRPASPGCGR